MAAMSIGDAARITGVPAWKLRAWEAKGVLTPLRAANGFRLYESADLARIRELQQQQSQGNRLGAFTPGESERYAEAPTRAERGHAWSELTFALRSGNDSVRIERACLDAILIATSTSIGQIDIADTTRHEFFTLTSRGLSESYLAATLNWQLHEGLAGRAFTMRRPVVAHDLVTHHGASRVSAWKQDLRGYLAVPMLLGVQRIGVIELFSREPRDFDSDQIEAAEEIATFTAALIDRHRTRDQLEKLRSQRNALTRQWTAQWSLATQSDRERVAEVLDVAARSLAKGQLDADQAQRLIESAARGVRASNRHLVNSEALILDQLRAQVPADRHDEVDVRFHDWPAQLPLEMASHVALAIGRLLTWITARLDGPVALRARGEGQSLVIEAIVPAPSVSPFDQLVSGESSARHLFDELDARYAVFQRDDGWSVQITVPRPKSANQLADLSPREGEVLAGLAMAKPNTQLAQDLGISVKTLQNHLTSIYRKLGVTNRVGAIALLTQAQSARYGLSADDAPDPGPSSLR